MIIHVIEAGDKYFIANYYGVPKTDNKRKQY